MGTMPASGAISFNDLRTQLGPSASGTNISISNYYRGGTYVPSGSTTREPTSGSNYSLTAPQYNFRTDYTPGGVGPFTTYAIWNNSLAGTFNGNSPPDQPASSITVGNITYYDAGFVFDNGSSAYSRIYREVFTAKNTSVPTSGQIDMNDFYGASNP